MAGLLAYRPGHRGHLYCRLVVHRGRRGERRSLLEADYAALLSAAHQQLHARVMLISRQPQHARQQADAGVRRGAHRLADRRPAPHLRARAQPPTEGVWSHLKRGLGNCAATGIDQLAAVVKTRLKRLQYRPELLEGFLSQTGLVLQPVPP